METKEMTQVEANLWEQENFEKIWKWEAEWFDQYKSIIFYLANKERTYKEIIEIRIKTN